MQRPLREADGSVAAEVADADILISGGALVDEAVLSQMRNVRFLLRPYVGYDDIDTDAATRHGILFANVPDAFIEEVANHAMALILAGNRKLLETDRVRQERPLVGWRAEPRGVRADPTSVSADPGLRRLRQHRPTGRSIARGRSASRFLASDPYVTQEAAAELGRRRWCRSSRSWPNRTSSRCTCCSTPRRAA